MANRFLAVLVCCAVSASVWALDEEPLVAIDEAHIYSKIDGDPILGKDLIDLKIEEVWDKELEGFVQHALTQDEIELGKITVTDADADQEVKYLLKTYADKIPGLDPKDLTPENLASKFNLQMSVLRRQTREAVAMLRLFQQEKIVKPDAHTDDRAFREALQQLLEKRLSEKGIVKDPKELGGGEGVRIGGRGYSKQMIRDFIAEAHSQFTKSEFERCLEALKLEKIFQHALAKAKLEITEDDLEFHFSYLCRQKELEPPFAPGRVVMRQMLAAQGITPEQFIHNRLTRIDATMTKLARAKIGAAQLQAEFKNNPKRYNRTEPLIAHIFIRVLDPEGRPYTPAWKVPGHAPLNTYVAQRRDEQFAAAKPKIDSLVEPAKTDFVATAKKFSDDVESSRVGGTIGRVGKETVLMPPCDVAVRDAAAKLKPGEISPPVRSDFGWHILKCLDQQDVTFDEAAEHVYVNLIHDRRASLATDLQTSAKIEGEK